MEDDGVESIYCWESFSDLNMVIPPWSFHPFVILSVNYMTYAVGGAWLTVSLMFPFFRNFPCYLYSYIPPDFQTVPTFIACMVYEMAWTAAALSTVVAFYCYWCADIFTINHCLSFLL